MSNVTAWTAEVVQDGEDLALAFPPDMMEQLGWVPGDVIVWDTGESGKVVIARKARADEL
jgi:antitoxin component of MazEF toxin-antitoxin module